MIIDIHSHAYPEKIHQLLGRSITDRSGYGMYGPGTEEALMASMEEAGIAYSVFLPVATRVDQAHHLNENAARLARDHDRLICFGSVHPEDPNWKEELRHIRDLGLRGLKLHPDFQKVSFQDPCNLRLMAAAMEMDLPVLFHAGVGPLAKNTDCCDPKEVRACLPLLRGDLLIAAHLGGLCCTDEAEAELVGEDLYLDISMSGRYAPMHQCRRMILNHRPDRVLFGSDTPWYPQKLSVELFRSMQLPADLEERLFWKNAAELLKLNV